MWYNHYSSPAVYENRLRTIVNEAFDSPVKLEESSRVRTVAVAPVVVLELLDNAHLVTLLLHTYITRYHDNVQRELCSNIYVGYYGVACMRQAKQTSNMSTICRCPLLFLYP